MDDPSPAIIREREIRSRVLHMAHEFANGHEPTPDELDAWRAAATWEVELDMAAFGLGPEAAG